MYLIQIHDNGVTLRPSISGLDGKYVERDTMDEVVDYLNSILNEQEQLQRTAIFWGYSDNDWNDQRYAVIDFKHWSVEVHECDSVFKENYKEPTLQYGELIA